MKMSAPEISYQYVTNSEGKKTGVILDLKTFETFLEEIEDAYLRVKAMAALDEDEALVSHDDVESRLLKNKRTKKKK